MTTPATNRQSLTHRAAQGALLGSIAAVIDRLNALAVQTALTYILLKSDFGIWSLASPIMGLSTILIHTTVRDLLIYRSSKFHLWSNPAAWLSTSLGFIAGIVVIILGIVATSVYDSPKLTLILLIASLQPIASGITTVPRAKLAIDMRFEMLAAFISASSIVSWVIVLLTAILGAGVYAFPAGIAITSVIQCVVIWFLAPVIIRSSPQIRRWKYIISDTGSILASNFAKWARTQGDRLILGAFLTESMMGIYFLAFQLSLQTFSVITLNLSSVLLPALASLNKEPDRQINAFIRSMRMLLFLAAPICAGTIVVATPLTNLIFDETKWTNLDTTLQLITAGMIFRAIEPPVKSLMNAQGRFKELLVLNIFSTISFALFITAILYASGFIGDENSPLYAAAIAGGAFHAVLAVILIIVALCKSDYHTLRALVNLSQPILYAALAAAGAWFAMMLLPQSLNELSPYAYDSTKIATAVIAFLIAYSVIARIHKPEEFDTLAAFVIRMTPSKLKPLNTKLASILFGCKPENTEQ